MQKGCFVGAQHSVCGCNAWSSATQGVMLVTPGWFFRGCTQAEMIDTALLTGFFWTKCLPTAPSPTWSWGVQMSSSFAGQSSAAGP